MPWTRAEREARCNNVAQSDQRGEFERDRDRILYSSAFHRLAGVTQIVRAGEFDIFHTRQQHTYKVAQIGRRLAQRFVEDPLEVHHGVDPEVVEAASLAHDLGHPPFGHAAEEELDELVQFGGGTREKPGLAEDCDPDGYEGNAQTFRILTKLAVRYDSGCNGLDLTRATLAATLKYPWLRDHNDDKKRGKWSAYRCEEALFDWVREVTPRDRRTAEAELMDWADDIAYSVHDLEDFHRVGVIPWHAVFADSGRDRMVELVQAAWFAAPVDAGSRIRKAWDNLKDATLAFPAVIDEVYDGSRRQRFQLRNLTSALIGRYINAVSLAEPGSESAICIPQESGDEVKLLKQIARHYVIGLPALRAQQYGQRRVIRELFNIFLTTGKSGKLDLLPARLRYIWQDHEVDGPSRLAADCVAMLTENEAYQLHQRLTGLAVGSVLDPIVR